MLAVEERLSRVLPVKITGSVSRIVGLTVSVVDFPAPLGSVCEIVGEHSRAVDAEVIGFHGHESLLLARTNCAKSE